MDELIIKDNHHRLTLENLKFKKVVIFGEVTILTINNVDISKIAFIPSSVEHLILINTKINLVQFPLRLEILEIHNCVVSNLDLDIEYTNIKHLILEKCQVSNIYTSSCIQSMIIKKTQLHNIYFNSCPELLELVECGKIKLCFSGIYCNIKYADFSGSYVDISNMFNLVILVYKNYPFGKLDNLPKTLIRLNCSDSPKLNSVTLPINLARLDCNNCPYLTLVGSRTAQIISYGSPYVNLKNLSRLVKLQRRIKLYRFLKLTRSASFNRYFWDIKNMGGKWHSKNISIFFEKLKYNLVKKRND